MTNVAISRKLSRLQRVACLAVTGAATTAPQSALEALLSLPKLTSFIDAEAKSTAYRLRHNISEMDMSIEKGHSSIWQTLTWEECSLLAPSDNAVAKYFFENRFSVSEEGTSVDLPANGDPWFIATAHDERGYSFGIWHETDNTTQKGYLGLDLGPKLASLASLLLCCQQALNIVGVVSPLILHLDDTSAITAVKSPRVRSNLATECIECLNELAESRAVVLTWTSATASSGNAKVAKDLANTALRERDLFIGPKPIIPNINYKAMRSEWLRNKTVSSWRTSHTGEHARRFLLESHIDFTRKLLSLKKVQS